MGSEVRGKCEERRLREATTSARDPFASVLGFARANVICGGQEIMSGRSVAEKGNQAVRKVRCTFVYVVCESVQVVEGIAAVLPLTIEDLEWKC